MRTSAIWWFAIILKRVSSSLWEEDNSSSWDEFDLSSRDGMGWLANGTTPRIPSRLEERGGPQCGKYGNTLRAFTGLKPVSCVDNENHCCTYNGKYAGRCCWQAFFCCVPGAHKRGDPVYCTEYADQGCCTNEVCGRGPGWCCDSNGFCTQSC
jgi:hypothetical protein